MRTERDFLGEVSVPADALYGIHSYRARNNFPASSPFSPHWYKACGTVKLACYRTMRKLLEAVNREYPGLRDQLRIPDIKVLGALESAASEVSSGSHFEHFIVPALQGGAGTSINMNINEIISNVALIKLGCKPGQYEQVDPIETANLFQSTNDIIPTGLTIATLRLLEELEEAINLSRARMEELEKRYRNSLRLGYTQMEEAVPSTFGHLFSTYNDALSRDWWRVSKAFERIKVVNLGGGATGTGMGIPRFYLMEVVPVLKNLCSLPVTQGENLADATANMDKWVEVHAILKAHAVNLEKIVSDLRLLSAGTGHRDIRLPARQVGSSIMPGKVNPVIPEYIVSGVQSIYANDQLITSLSARGCLELNAYLPQIGSAMLDSLTILIAMNSALRKNLLEKLEVDEDRARERLYRSVAMSTALAPLLGYHRAGELSRIMKEEDCDIFEANRRSGILPVEKMKELMDPAKLLKKGFTMKDLEEMQ